MAKNHQPLQTERQETFAQTPIYIEQDSTTLINQTGDSNPKPNHWPTIILCFIFVTIGQFIAKLLEKFHYDQTKRQNGVWNQSLLQTVGFPLLLIPYFTAKKHNQQQQPPITSTPSSTKYIIAFSGCLGVILDGQARYSAKAKLENPSRASTLIYTTQLVFTLLFAAFVNKIKFNRWIVISLILALATGALTGGELDKVEEDDYSKGLYSAVFSGAYFSIFLCIIQSVFKDNGPTAKKSSFSSVLEVLMFSFLCSTFISVVRLLVYGEQHDMMREMNGFSKGKVLYVMAMVGQAISWQFYWVGIVGLVFSVSSVLSNVISVITWPIVSVFVVIFFGFKEDEFDVFKGVALITAVLTATAYFYKLQKENQDSDMLAK